MAALVGRALSLDSWGVLYVSVVARSLDGYCGSLLAAIIVQRLAVLVLQYLVLGSLVSTHGCLWVLSPSPLVFS